MSLDNLGAVEIATRVRAGELSARAVVDAALARIEAHDSAVGSFLTVTADAARAAADRVDEIVASGGDPGPLAGVPVAVKDNICTRGVATTCASRILDGFVPPYDATVVTRLVDAGAVIVGKTNLDEFAMGSSSENSALGRTVNPWDVTKVPGGSSGGSAAAVAAGLVPVSLGSDTGGSIRQPASFCGVVGVKPTYGRVSRYGLVAFASSLDQIGPFTRSAEDAALVLSALCGHDPRDSTSLPGPAPDFSSDLESGIAGLRIGIPREYFAEGITEPVRRSVEAAIAVLKSLGAEIGEVSLPHTDYSLPAYYI
ncbi:MAG: amidase, partial [Armatimonadaceae bacterium]